MKGLRKRNQIKWIGITLAMIIMTVGMLAVFIRFSDIIHEETLDKEIQHLEMTSGYITKIIQLEMERCIEILKVSEETLCVSDNPLQDKMQEVLKEIEEKTDFNAIGIVNLEGESIDDNGIAGGLSDSEFIEKIKNGESYISDTLTSGEKEVGQILVAVPLHNNGKIVGAIWGQYPVTVIAEKTDLTKDSDMYFQIIDSRGDYISRSGNRHALAEDVPLWEELKAYELSKGETIEKLQADVENHKSGTFHLEYKGEGRFVAYEPLGINNWYVFSILVEDSVNTYVDDVKHHSLNLLLCFSLFIAILFGIIGITGYRGRNMIKKQNKQLAVKTQLFKMILSKTKDVPFEIDLKKKRLKIYHHDLLTDSREECEIIEDFSLDAMLDSGRIRKKDMDKYKEMYKESIGGREANPYIFKIKVKNSWEWDKIHLLAVDNESMVGFFENYEEQIEKNRQIEEMDYKTKHDTLTGVYNRSAIGDEVETYLKTAGETEGIFALFLLDLDNFKELNDSLGHLAGDKALADVAMILKKIKRKGDVVGRIGGDEFMLFMKGAADMDEVHEYARKLNDALRKSYGEKEKTVTVSASIGIAVVKEEKTFLELYEKADEALYKVKKHHRNGYMIE